MDLDRFASLKERVESMRRERDQSVGAEKELRKRLKEEFGTDNTTKAKLELKKIEDEIAVLERKERIAMDRLEKHWSEKLSEKREPG